MNEGGPTAAWLESSNGNRTPIEATCFLGRAAACEVVLADARVSRQHALVQRQHEHEFWLIDLGSANGTYLNGQRVRHPCRLSDGDSISIAGLTFGFRCPRTRRPGAMPFSDATVQEIRHDTCWMLVADIQGSTVMLRKLPAEEAPRVTGQWLAACRRILQDHGGTINKFLGDGFFAYWPAATAAKPIADTLRALQELQETANPPFRLVLHYGRVLLSGIASLGEEGLSGDDVNFVFRMEKLAGTLGVSRLLSEPAQKKLAGLLSAKLEGHHTLPGFEGEFAFYDF
jgi:class 3 adenylate cyclase